MKALVLGAGGQLGRALLASAPIGAEVTGLARGELDIGDAAAVNAAVSRTAPEIIFNAAAHTAVDQAEGEPDAAFRINRDGVINILAAAEACGARVVHVSTDFVFDGRGCRPYLPADPTGPLGVYGASKLAGEAAALEAGALVVRTAWVYAAQGRNFVRTMLRLFGERPVVRVVADQIGAPTSAGSLALALWGLAGQGASGLHHFTDAGVASWYDLAVATSEEGQALGLCSGQTAIEPIATADYPTPAQRPSYSVLDCRATYAALGRPARHWRQELRSTLTQVRELAHV